MHLEQLQEKSFVSKKPRRVQAQPKEGELRLDEPKGQAAQEPGSNLWTFHLRGANKVPLGPKAAKIIFCHLLSRARTNSDCCWAGLELKTDLAAWTSRQTFPIWNGECTEEDREGLRAQLRFGCVHNTCHHSKQEPERRK